MKIKKTGLGEGRDKSANRNNQQDPLIIYIMQSNRLPQFFIINKYGGIEILNSSNSSFFYLEFQNFQNVYFSKSHLLGAKECVNPQSKCWAIQEGKN